MTKSDLGFSHSVCTCGHKQKDHEDIGIFNSWGLGKCTMGLCECKKFDCKDCFDEEEE